MKRVLLRLSQVAMVDGNVLIEGETGVGKTHLARWFHSISPWRDRPLVVAGCGEFATSMIEDSLYGHRKGAFTGAIDEGTGFLEVADGGTFVLDDIDYLNLASQTKFLRFLDDRKFRPLGFQGREHSSTVRLVATTNKDLKAAINDGKFLEDLYFRLRRWRIRVPPIRERPEDLRAIAQEALANLQAQIPDGEDAPWCLADEVIDLFQCLPWRGNARELRDTVENIAVFSTGSRRPIGLQEAADIIFDRDQFPDAPVIDDNDSTLLQVLTLTRWNLSLTSRILNRSRNTIYTRLKANGWERQRTLFNSRPR